MNNNGEFFLVWNPDGNMPRVRHLSVTDAVDESKRLARLNPGERFYVLRAITVAQSVDPVTVTDLDDGVPF